MLTLTLLRIVEAFPIVDIIPLLISGEDVTTNGLQDNLIYDVPVFATDVPVSVPGVALGVTCLPIVGASQSGPYNFDNGTFPIHVNDKLENINVSPGSVITSHSFRPMSDVVFYSLAHVEHPTCDLE